MELFFFTLCVKSSEYYFIQIRFEWCVVHEGADSESILFSERWDSTLFFRILCADV